MQLNMLGLALAGGTTANLSNIQLDMMVFISTDLGPLTSISELRVQTKGQLPLGTTKRVQNRCEAVVLHVVTSHGLAPHAISYKQSSKIASSWGRRGWWKQLKGARRQLQMLGTKGTLDSNEFSSARVLSSWWGSSICTNRGGLPICPGWNLSSQTFPMWRRLPTNLDGRPILTRWQSDSAEQINQRNVLFANLVL